ncbi:MAG: hypothetical protein V2I51_10995 [Anderseniella sp.]|jgi:hypothetical protein|nr:hypothetical protein [Anderseniella sp.]
MTANTSNTQAFSIPVEVAIAQAEIASAAIHATKGVAPQHGTNAAFLVSLAKTGNETGIHLTLVALQDRCTTGPSWNVARAGVNEALKALGYKIDATRNYRSGKGAFTLVSLSEAKSAREQKERDEQALADRAEAEAVAAAQAADMAVTVADIANAAVAEAKRLGLSVTELALAMVALAEAEADTGALIVEAEAT